MLHKIVGLELVRNGNIMRKNFTKEEDEYIISKHTVMRLRDIGIILNRSYSSVSQRLHRLKLSVPEFIKFPVKQIIFGKLTVQERDFSRKGKFRYFWCLCKCGNRVSRLLSDLKRERGVASCGCFLSELKLGEKGLQALHHKFLNYKNKSKEKNRIFEISEDFFIFIIKQDCHYCGAKPTMINCYLDKYGKPHKVGIRQATIDNGWAAINGIDRKDSSIGYTEKNCLPCCSTCNRAKSDMSYEDFILYIKNLISFNKNNFST